MNQNKFTGKADIYAKFRPTYPTVFIDYLYSEAGFGQKSIIADIGSGTGILTKLLLSKASTVFAVEPNEDMRKIAETNLGHFSRFVSVNGTAEKTTLTTSSCDFITVAQAFHWFDGVRFREEASRILKQNGKIAIIYNTKDNKHPLTIEKEQINKQYCTGFKGFSGGMANANPEDFRDFFGGTIDFKSFKNDLVYDEESFIGNGLSTSYAPKETDETYTAYITALKNLFKKYSSNGKICLPNSTISLLGKI